MGVWGSFLIAASALKTPTRNSYTARGVNLTFKRRGGGYSYTHTARVPLFRRSPAWRPTAPAYVTRAAVRYHLPFFHPSLFLFLFTRRGGVFIHSHCTCFVFRRSPVWRPTAPAYVTRAAVRYLLLTEESHRPHARR